jgi:hypothetical protein
MPLENLEEEGLEKNPNLDLALWKFLLSLPDHSGDAKLQSKLMEVIIADSKYILKNYVSGMLEITSLSQKVNTCVTLTANKTGAVLEFEDNLFLALLYSRPRHVRTLILYVQYSVT